LARLRWLSILIHRLPVAGRLQQVPAQEARPHQGRGHRRRPLRRHRQARPLCHRDPLRRAQAGEKNDEGDPLPAAETTITDLDGRFASRPSNPAATMPSPPSKAIWIRCWASIRTGSNPCPATGTPSVLHRSVEGSPHRSHRGRARVSEISMQIERAAEISGTVTFDDGTPGHRHALSALPQDRERAMTEVGLPLLDSWSICTP
jgi:hypothetical protein